MEIINQPLNEQLGNRIISMLKSAEYNKVVFIVAFAKEGGVLRLKEALDSFRATGGTVKVYVGIDLGGTSYEALSALYESVDSLNIVHTENRQTFHSKIFNFIKTGESVTIIGSHNLTAGGLWTNFESSLVVRHDTTGPKGQKFQNDMDDFASYLDDMGDSVLSVSSQDDIDKLLDNGYITKEILQRINQFTDSGSRSRKRKMFGNGISVQIPPRRTPTGSGRAAGGQGSMPPSTASSGALQLSSKDDILWYSTQSLTGGSGNQIDLSMQSRLASGDARETPYDIGVSGFMQGAVQFFGVNPQRIEEEKSVTINYLGKDYVGNVIKYPHHNGTWRLQLEGRSAADIRLTSLFPNGGLKWKIIAFTRIDEDYFSLSVHPDDLLEEFKELSTLWGGNGSSSNARPIGLILSDVE